MEPEKEQKIQSLLVNKLNPWWRDVRLNVPEFRRSDFDYLYSQIKIQKSLTLIGPRQVGKTTVVRQIIQELIASGIKSNRILYADLGDVEIRLNTESAMHDILQIYQKNILSEDFSNLTSDVYVFLDEVQHDQSWAETVKSYVDHYPKLHMLLTGSSSLKVSYKSKETLPGRSQLQIMLPLKFVDFLRLRYQKTPEKLNAERLRILGKEMRNWFIAGLEKKDLKEFVKLCAGQYQLFLPQEAEIHAAFTAYLSRGGYPEIATKAETADCQRLLTSYANDVIVKDLAVGGNVRNIDLAEKMLYLLAMSSAEKLNKDSMMKRIKDTNFITTNKYVDLFKEVFLLSEIPIFSGSKLGSTKHPKIYFQDIGLRNAICGVLDVQFTETDSGHLAETVACDHIKRLAFKLNQNSFGHIYCYSSEKSGRDESGETDFIVELPRYKLKLPIEVKYRKNIGGLNSMREFMAVQKQPFGIVLTRDNLKMQENIAHIPLWMFAIMS